jgi:hypothetical protein
MSLAATKCLQITLQSFKPLSLETIKARTTNLNMSERRYFIALQHIRRGINLEPAIAALRGDEPRTNL